MRRRMWIASVLTIVALAIGCTAPPAPVSVALPPEVSETVTGDIVVFAAASLTDAFREIAADFQRLHPGARVVLNFGGSSQLRVQLENGARADVFASADQAQMDAARRAAAVVS